MAFKVGFSVIATPYFSVEFQETTLKPVFGLSLKVHKVDDILLGFNLLSEVLLNVFVYTIFCYLMHICIVGMFIGGYF